MITPEGTDEKCTAIYQFLLTKLYLKLSSAILPPFVREGELISRWRHDMKTFSALQALCEGKPLVFFDVTLNELFNKQSMYQWFGAL